MKYSFKTQLAIFIFTIIGLSLAVHAQTNPSPAAATAPGPATASPGATNAYVIPDDLPEVTEFRVMTCNLLNWMNTDRRIEGKHVKAAEKPQKEKDAIMAIIKKMNPDILLVQEMGNDAYFEDFCRHLDRIGWKVRGKEHIVGISPRSTIALVSKFPIVARSPKTADRFVIAGKEEGVQRGFIDVDIAITKDMVVKVMGAHLKSKRGETDVNSPPSLLRRREALLLRGYMTDFMASQPNGYLVVMGDLNDTFGSEPLKTIVATKMSEYHCYDLWLTDWAGDRWTHYYEYEREYAQIDYIIVNKNLFRHFVQDSTKSYVYRNHPNNPEDVPWSEASDHRPVMATFSVQPQEYVKKPRGK
ncbi:MAG: endonuclease/exonuclease/phosphatase family protein [Verrucomicrobiae bacterium]|nr:endonuclease/exonuclease/phosphatase family protein [Verrucomicrobiae bacterium]